MKSMLQFFKVTRWVFVIYWAISPILTATVLVTHIFLQVQTVVYAYIFGVTLDKILLLIETKEARPEEILRVIWLFVLFSLASSVVSVINTRASNLLGNRDHFKLKQFLYDHLIMLGLAKLEDPELTNKTTRYNEMYGFINQHLQRAIGLIASIMLLLTSGAIVVSSIPILLPAFLLFFIVKFFINQNFISKMWVLSRTTTETRRNANQSAGYLVDPNGLKELLITRGNLYLKQHFERFFADYTSKLDNVYRGWVRFELIQSILDALLYGAGLYLIVVKGISGAITIGTITFLIRSLSSFSDQLDGLTYRISGARESALRIKDAQEVFELYTPEVDGEAVLGINNVPPAIEFHNVSFTYPQTKTPVFTNINVSIKPGEKIAIVGENGAGKTTLVKLLSRLYKVSEGEILLDNINLQNVKIQSFYDKLGILFQDYNMYSNLTVFENVAMGRSGHEKVDTKKVIQALKDAQAYEFVKKYPNKLNQVLSERYKGGIRPSTGQWQKIAIARFFYRNAPILILDEPTASIDAVSEAQIFDNIYKFMNGKTVIIISHRFSTVRNADRIIVLDKGRIIEDGSHVELLAKNGKYAKSFKLQAKGYS